MDEIKRNAGQPCGTCGGSKTIPLPSKAEGEADWRPCPDCQPRGAETHKVLTDYQAAQLPQWACEQIESQQDLIIALKMVQKKTAARIEELEKAIEESRDTIETDAVQGTGEWQTGMFCGLEDRNITDRYDACQYGYEAALDRVREWVIEPLNAALGEEAKDGA